MACMGLTGIAGLLESCSAPLQVFKLTPATGSNMVSVPLSAFTEKVIMVLIRDPDLEDDVLVVKSNGVFNALLMTCTHESQSLTATNRGIYCNEHGSRFDFTGKVLKEPALDNLTRYKTESTENSVNIYLNQQI